MTVTYRELDAKHRPVIVTEEEPEATTPAEPEPEATTPAEPEAAKPSPFAHTPLSFPGTQPAAGGKAPTKRPVRPLTLGHIAAIAVTLGLFALAGYVLLIQPAAPPAASSTTAVVNPTAIPTSPPATSASLQPSPAIAGIHDGERVLTWAIDVYDLQGHWVGPIAAGRPFRVDRAEGTEWMVIEAREWAGAPASGLVKVHAVDLLTSPPPRPTPIPTTPPPPPAPVYEPAYQPAAPVEVPVEAQPTMAPPPTSAPATEPTAEPRCGTSGWCRRPNEDTKRSPREVEHGEVRSKS